MGKSWDLHIRAPLSVADPWPRILDRQTAGHPKTTIMNQRREIDKSDDGNYSHYTIFEGT